MTPHPRTHTAKPTIRARSIAARCAATAARASHFTCAAMLLALLQACGSSPGPSKSEGAPLATSAEPKLSTDAAPADPYQQAADDLQSLLRSGSQPTPTQPSSGSTTSTPNPRATARSSTKPSTLTAGRPAAAPRQPRVFEAPPPPQDPEPRTADEPTPTPAPLAINRSTASDPPQVFTSLSPSTPLPAPTPTPQPTPASATPPQPEPPAFRISALHACTRIEAFGRFTKADTTRIPAGRPTPLLIYAELDGFSHRTAAGLAPPPDAANAPDDGTTQWIIEIGQELAVFSSAGRLQFKIPEQFARDEAKRRRRDHYLVQRVTLPATLPPGSYVMVVTARDLATSATDQARLPFSVVAPSTPR